MKTCDFLLGGGEGCAGGEFASERGGVEGAACFKGQEGGGGGGAVGVFEGSLFGAEGGGVHGWLGWQRRRPS